jgi:hypothetical protein
MQSINHRHAYALTCHLRGANAVAKYTGILYGWKSVWQLNDGADLPQVPNKVKTQVELKIGPGIGAGVNWGLDFAADCTRNLSLASDR